MRRSDRLRRGVALLDPTLVLERVVPDPSRSRRPLTLLGLVLVVVNLLPAAALFGYLEALDPSASDAPDPARARVVAVVLLVCWSALSVAVIGVRARRELRPVADWLATDRTAEAAERRAVLQAPLRTAGRVLFAWTGAAVAFGVASAALDYRPARTVVVVAAIVLAGVSAASLAALLTERMLRPLRARALAGRLVAPSGVGVQRRMLLSWAFGSAVPLVGVVLLPVDQGSRTLGASQVPLSVLCAAAVVSGLVIIAGAARSVAQPLGAVRAALVRIEAGDLDVVVDVDDTGEVGQVQAAINGMVAGLRERRRLEDLFGRYVGAEVAAHALAHGVDLAGQRTDASIVFVDLIGSTALAARRPPEEVVATLNALFSAVVGAVGAEGGWVNKFEGDGALCVFGPPAGTDDHAARALRAATAMREALAAAARAHPDLDAAIGVSSGAVVAGNIGADARLEYTVIGDPVNEAARLSDAAKTHPSRLLASARVVAAAGRAGGGWVAAGQVVLRGRSEATDLCVPEPVAVRS